MASGSNGRVYTVLKAVSVDNGEGKGTTPVWVPVGNFHALGSETAVRDAVEKYPPSEGQGVYKAVPIRSWDPTYDVSIETRPVTHLAARKGEGS